MKVLTALYRITLLIHACSIDGQKMQIFHVYNVSHAHTIRLRFCEL